jgi:excisionase family DNA binding protein
MNLSTGEKAAKSTEGSQIEAAPSILRDSQIYTPGEVARTLRVSAVTVSRAIREGKLRAFRVGGQWRVVGSELKAYIKSQTAQALDVSR